MGVIITAAALVVALAVVVNRLRPAQRLVVLVGTVAAAVQVFYPPCVQTDGTVTRRWLDTSLTYSDPTGVLIDAGRQAIWLTVTAAVVVAACFAIGWRHRVGGE